MLKCDRRKVQMVPECLPSFRARPTPVAVWAKHLPIIYLSNLKRCTALQFFYYLDVIYRLQDDFPNEKNCLCSIKVNFYRFSLQHTNKYIFNRSWSWFSLAALLGQLASSASTSALPDMRGPSRVASRDITRPASSSKLTSLLRTSLQKPGSSSKQWRHKRWELFIKKTLLWLEIRRCTLRSDV